MAFEFDDLLQFAYELKKIRQNDVYARQPFERCVLGHKIAGDNVSIPIYRPILAIVATVQELMRKFSSAQEQTFIAEQEFEKAKLGTEEANEAKGRAERAKAEGMLQAAGELESEELSAQIEESNHGAEVQSLRIRETATPMEEMNATEHGVPKNASLAADHPVMAPDKAQERTGVAGQSANDKDQLNLSAYLKYKESALQGNRLFIGWENTKLDADADDFTRQQYKIKKYVPGRGSFYRSISYQNDGHCLTIAPTGAGKGVGVIIPNLLSYTGSIIVIDPKGENYSVTARFRKELGQKVLLLDPFEEVAGNAAEKDRGSLNPFDFVSTEPIRGEEEAQTIAEIISGGHSSRDPFWDCSAKGWLAGLIHSIATSSIASERNITTLIKQSSDNSLWYDDIDLCIETEKKGRHFKIFEQKSISDFAKRAFENVTIMPFQTKGGVIGYANSYLSIFSSVNVCNSMKCSTLSPKELAEDNGSGYTIYIVIPPSKLVSHAKLLRLWITSLLNALMTRKEGVKKRTLFLLDECAQLGSLPQLKLAVTLLRGYGLQTWMFFQDFSQIRQLYPADYETLVNNCSVLQTFGNKVPLAAEGLLRFMHGKEVEDLMRMSSTQQMVTINGSKPKICQRGNYLIDPIFAGRFDANPRFPEAAN